VDRSWCSGHLMIRGVDIWSETMSRSAPLGFAILIVAGCSGGSGTPSPDGGGRTSTIVGSCTGGKETGCTETCAVRTMPAISRPPRPKVPAGPSLARIQQRRAHPIIWPAAARFTKAPQLNRSFATTPATRSWTPTRCTGLGCRFRVQAAQSAAAEAGAWVGVQERVAGVVANDLFSCGAW